MKILIISFILVFQVSISQNTFLTGVIKNSFIDNIELEYASNIFINKEYTIKTELDENNHFAISLTLETPKLFFLKIGRLDVEIFLSPKDSLNIVVTNQNGNTEFDLSGIGSINNEYLLKENYYFRKEIIDSRLYDYQHWEILEPFSREYRNNRMKYFNEYKKKHNVSPFFNKFQSFKIQSDYLSRIILAYYYKDTTTPEGYKKEVILKNINDSILNQLDFVKSGFIYENIVSDIIGFKWGLENKSKDLKMSERLNSNYLFIKNNLPKKIFEMQAAIFFIKNISMRNINTLKPLYQDYRQNCNDTEFLLAVQKEFDKYNNTKMQFPKNVSLINIDSTEIKLNKILNQYKNKVVYIDFWGTWCKPCIKAIPYNIDLQKKYEDKDVVFIFFGIESNFHNWKKIIKKYNIIGEHFLIKDENTEIFQHKLFIKGYPSYLLIDKKGNIMEASSPKSNNIINEIDRLLNE